MLGCYIFIWKINELDECAKHFTPYSLVGLWRGLGFGRFLVGNQKFIESIVSLESHTPSNRRSPMVNHYGPRNRGKRSTTMDPRSRQGSDKSGIKMDCEFAMPPGRW